ncbi:MAG: Ig-like domain-containing protein [Propionibacteriaceae bacterium]|nr:Ig-like domain-containing protein [Propionibacteriaceae bacterium]
MKLLGSGLAACALLVSMLVCVASPAQAKTQAQPPEPARTMHPERVIPDISYNIAGGRVEIYNSIGENDGGEDWRQMVIASYLVNSVPKGGITRIATYNFWQDGYSAKLNPDTNKWDVYTPDGEVADVMPPLTEAFRNQLNLYDTPEQRKAHLLILGQRDRMKESYKVGSGMAKLLMDAGVVKFCVGQLYGCLTTSKEGEMHAKFGLFSQTRDSNGKLWKNVLYSTTVNYNGTSGGKKSNTTIVIYGDSKLYNGVLNNVWKPMYNEHRTAGYNKAAEQGIKGKIPGITYYPSPRQTDFERLYLENMLAENGGRKAGTSCKIVVAQIMFSEGRKKIFEALVQLKAEGCSVRILTDPVFLDPTLVTYFQMYKTLRSVLKDVTVAHLHDKTMTVIYTNSAGKRVYGMFTGSANFNGPGLLHDESTLFVTHQEAVEGVNSHLQRIYNLVHGGKAKHPVRAVTLSSNALLIHPKETVKVKASILPTNATKKTIRWTTNRSSVATVSSTGVVTGVSPGTATLTARSFQGGVTATATIVVSNSHVVEVKPSFTLARTAALGSWTTVNVSWGSYTGTVSLNYFSQSRKKWIRKDFIPVVNGVGSYSFQVTESAVYRIRAEEVTNPADSYIWKGVKLTASQPQLAVPAAADTTPVLTAPSVFSKGTIVPFAVTYAPGGKVTLQYKKGSKWVNKKTVTMSGSTYTFSVEVSGSSHWRVRTATGAVSASVYLPVASASINITTHRPKLLTPASCTYGKAFNLTAHWTPDYTTKTTRKLYLQFQVGTTWRTYKTITIPSGKNWVSFKIKQSSGHRWRLYPAATSVPWGYRKDPSWSRMILCK